MTNDAYDFDIIVAGGGMVGTCLALALAPLRLRVAVVEAVQRSAASQPSFDDRSTALSRSTQRMFEAMGLWDDVEAASTAIKKIHVSDRGRFGFSHIDADEQGVEALGHVVINRVLGEVLQQRLDCLAEVEWHSPARIVSQQCFDDRIVVSVEDDADSSQYSCRLLVAADGANSRVRDMIGIGARKIDYGQMAIVGNLRSEKPMDKVAYERFTDSGPLALLPITDNRCAFVWTLSTADANSVLSLTDEQFVSAIQEAFGNRLGAFSRVGTRAAYPLTLSKASSLTARRAVLVGNAAHGLHPVAAQGFNLGLRDVAALCDCLFDARRDQHDIGHSQFDPGRREILDAYADWRRSDQRKLVRFTDGLVRLFGSRQRPLAALRGIGMLAFDLVPGIRRMFARHTMGLAGRLPRLSRGVPLE